MSDTTTGQGGPVSAGGVMLSADGRPLKQSLARAQRRQRLRAFLLVAPLLAFVLIAFVAPIADMLFRSVENEIVPETLPRTVAELRRWDERSGSLPPEEVFVAMARDLQLAETRKLHTRVGQRLNYEYTGVSSLFRKTGRRLSRMGRELKQAFVGLDPAWGEPATWVELIGAPDWREAQAAWAARRARAGADAGPEPLFRADPAIAALLPQTADFYAAFARAIQTEDGDSPTEEAPWPLLYDALYRDLSGGADLSRHTGPHADLLRAAAAAVPGFPPVSIREEMLKIDDGWGDVAMWQTIKAYSGRFTNGYFLAALDMKKTPDGIAMVEENRRIYLMLFWRTLLLSVGITLATLVLGYPVAWLLANLPARHANLLLILVLLPFWTSLLVRTSAWKVLLQQQGVINDLLVWIGLISDDARLVMINNQTGTIIAMTHILLPFMVLPLYSVMKTIPPSYLRAAKSLGATNWTAFWRVYFPLSVPGIGAGAILVFILSIGYYITPELVGGTSGIFISNRIAYHISISLNWGLAAALGSILLFAVLILYWTYDRIVGIDNVKLG